MSVCTDQELFLGVRFRSGIVCYFPSAIPFKNNNEQKAILFLKGKTLHE